MAPKTPMINKSSSVPMAPQTIPATTVPRSAGFARPIPIFLSEAAPMMQAIGPRNGMRKMLMIPSTSISPPLADSYP
jgi:hypothetical protein